MKNFIVALVLVLTASVATAQRYSPYAGVGVTLSEVTYTAEVGATSANSRYAATLAVPDSGNTVSLGAKGYWRLANRATENVVDVFATGGVSAALVSGNKPLTIEPGLAAVFNFGQFRPQVSVGFPIEQNAVFRNRPLGFTAGLSVNYVF